MSVSDFLRGIDTAARALAVLTVRTDDSILAAEHVLHRVEQIRNDRRFCRALRDMDDQTAREVVGEVLVGQRVMGDASPPRRHTADVDCDDSLLEHVLTGG